MLPGLTSWVEPKLDINTYGAGNFRVFLPSGAQPFGEPYYIIESEFYGRRPHMNFYHPPEPKGTEILLHVLLSHFHPNVFVNCRFGPRGTLAIVRAQNEEYYDIVIR